MADMRQDEKEDHIPEQSLEDYSRGALPEAEVERLEEHLLVCPHCQDRLADVDDFVKAMRGAAAKLQMEPPSALEDHWRGAWRWFWRPVPVMALSGAAAMIVAGVALRQGLPPGAGAATVTLQAMRGDAFAGSRAPAGRPLVFRLDAKGLPALASYRMEIVDAHGAALFASTVKRGSDSIMAAVPNRLQPGRYWVRLYDPAGSLLREFGFTVN